MARRTRQSFNKRKKEQARQQKQLDKRAKRLEIKERRDEPPPPTAGDPDLEGIVPGPQPAPPWLEDGARRDR
ncbi:MAG TPA: hypothetical protein VJV23_02605 [Candidatus Polarisedimenticolia bacterium]|nr:hypothetical protein [Candidatus Polarisedimenticolia bacterium]